MNIYVASSWRNTRQPAIVEQLRSAGHEVYDFKNPPNGAGFGWEEVGEYDADGNVSADEYLRMIDHPRALEGFLSDFDAMVWADAVVLVLPCGKSAHLELGWATGAGKRSAILLEDPMQPELMYLCAEFRTADIGELIEWLG